MWKFLPYVRKNILGHRVRSAMTVLGTALLLFLFVLRVAGQVLVAFFNVRFLPPMEAWYSGLMPYEYLLPSQVVLIAVMTKICIDFSRERGFFYETRKFFATAWLWFGYVYLAAMEPLGVTPGRCAVVEDTVTGVTAGVAAGATVFGYSPPEAGHDAPAALRAAGATAVFASMAQLPSLLD